MKSAPYRRQLRRYWPLLTCLLVPTIAPAQDSGTAARGVLKGGAPHAAPDWFKESFLEFQEDAAEAGEADKHLMLFFQLNACPYCDRMLGESFEADPNMSYMQRHFDVIAVNVKGDREIVFNEEITVLEKELAEILQVRATPAIVFLDAENQSVARVNGYRAPPRFRKVLEYVSTKAYRKTTLASYMARNLTADVYELRDNPLFKPLKDLSGIDGPLLVILENASCYDCVEFHDRLLTHADVKKELERFTVVRLDTDSAETIVDVSGNETTAGALAEHYAMSFRPGVLIFDAGELVRRYDSLLFSFHFKEGLRYISGGHYKNGDYRSYSQSRREALLAQGVDINLAD
ncbi:MAG: thioredoxin fold domain-containing protein [Gammaproteobacteria bacterium]|nr:thioredoxin fold domain-containing protein [Gammaproteobacteria bacterium]